MAHIVRYETGGDGRTILVMSDGTRQEVFAEIRNPNREDFASALQAVSGESDEPALSNGIPGLLGLGGLTAKWGLDRLPWWIWAALAAGVVAIVASRSRK